MRAFVTVLTGGCLVALGYVLGASQFLSPSAQAQAVPAQQETESGFSEETDQKITNALRAVKSAMDALIEEKHYVPAITGLNTFAVTSGGGDIILALEEGHGVDPETYAGLYAGMAIEEIRDKLEEDEAGRLTYNGKVIKMYPKSYLRKLYMQRESMLK